MNIKEMEREWGKFPEEDKIVDDNGTPAWGQSLLKQSLNRLEELCAQSEKKQKGEILWRK